MNLDGLPPGLLDRVVGTLTKVPGIAAIGLGGSRARGTAHAGSDVDLGLYFRAEAPIDLKALETAATRLDDRKAPGLVTRIGEWGPWVIGGGWLKIEGHPVDLLYREIVHVERVLNACRMCQVTYDYQVGHPHCFPSSIYAGETATCLPLWDPRGELSRLKSLAVPYPVEMGRELIRRFGWEAQFSIDVSRKGVPRADVHYVAGCLFRCVACLAQVLFAINQQHLLNEKGALALAVTFPRRPDCLVERVNAAYAQLHVKPESLSASLDVLQALKNEIDAIVDGGSRS
jgi:predicted nucleotidyltransferase